MPSLHSFSKQLESFPSWIIGNRNAELSFRVSAQHRIARIGHAPSPIAQLAWAHHAGRRSIKQTGIGSLQTKTPKLRPIAAKLHILRSFDRLTRSPPKLTRFLFLLAVLVASGSAHANDPVACVQRSLNDLLYNTGMVDGVLGRKTRAALHAYVQDRRVRQLDLRRFLIANEEHIDDTNAAIWCEYFSRAHPVKDFAFGSYRYDKPGVFQSQSDAYDNGWSVRVYGTDTAYRDLAIFIPGDFRRNDPSYGDYRYLCDRIFDYIPSDALFACIYRPYASQWRIKQQPREVTELADVIAGIQMAIPETRLHCAGHSGGGHSCMALAQQENVTLTCVAVSAAPIAYKILLRANRDTRSWIQRAYDPMDHLKKTSAREITIIGDPQDTVTAPQNWMRFYKRAKQAGLPVKLLEMPGEGHRGVKYHSAIELGKCIVAASKQSEGD